MKKLCALYTHRNASHHTQKVHVSELTHFFQALDYQTFFTFILFIQYYVGAHSNRSGNQDQNFSLQKIIIREIFTSP